MIEYNNFKYKIYDAHTHWSKLMSKILKPLLELLSTNEILDITYEKWNFIKKKAKNKIELKILMYKEILDYYGIDKSNILPVFQFDVDFSILCQKYFPERIVGFGALKPRDKEENLLKRFNFLKQNHVKGIKLHAQYNKFNVKIHQREITRVLELISENKMIALFHSGSHYDIKDLAPILKKIDDIPIILGHSGLAPQVDQAINLAIQFSNVYLETSGQPYDYLIEYMVKNPNIGVERVIFGSDLPTLDPTFEMMKILTLSISESEKQLIFYDNMQKLLK